MGHGSSSTAGNESLNKARDLASKNAEESKKRLQTLMEREQDYAAQLEDFSRRGMPKRDREKAAEQVANARKAIAAVQSNIEKMTGIIERTYTVEGVRDNHEMEVAMNQAMREITGDGDMFRETFVEAGSHATQLALLSDMMNDAHDTIADTAEEDPVASDATIALVKEAELENAYRVIQQIDEMASMLGTRVPASLTLGDRVPVGHHPDA